MLFRSEWGVRANAYLPRMDDNDRLKNIKRPVPAPSQNQPPPYDKSIHGQKRRIQYRQDERSKEARVGRIQLKILEPQDRRKHLQAAYNVNTGAISVTENERERRGRGGERAERMSHNTPMHVPIRKAPQLPSRSGEWRGRRT